MLSQSDLTASVNAYERSVKDSIRIAKQVTLPIPTHFCFSTLGLTEAKISELAKRIKTGKRKDDIRSEFLYVFRLCSENSVATEDIMRAFSIKKTSQKSPEYTGKKNLCRENLLTAHSRALYVGRSYSPRERFKQHLRASASGTYAIHLAEWASYLDIRIEFFLYQFFDAGDRAIQAIEDGLWDHLKPLMGRRGER